MIRKLSKNLVPLTAIVASTLLGSGLANAASMASDASQTSVSAASNAPVAVTMQQLDERVAKVPALASLKSGDQVSISDDGSVTGLVWQGTYTFYPAGSVVPVAPMYVRWKDGLVALTLTPAPQPTDAIPFQQPPGTLDANWIAPRFDQVGNNLGNFQDIHVLVSDSSDSSILRIPANAWLFRVNSNGQYTTLVDAFVFQSGGQPQLVTSNPSATPTYFAMGSQPVPVSAGYWQP